MGGNFRVLNVLLLRLVMLSAAREIRNVTFPLISYCPKSCGNVSIPYPFGIGEGCFRSGLNLTCDGSTNPPKLFLADSTMEVISFDVTEAAVYINSNIITMSSSTSFYSNPLITLDSKRPYRLYGSFDNGEVWMGNVHNSLFVVGCSVVAYLMDLDDNTTVGKCTTTCPTENFGSENFDSVSCNGIGCCSIGVPGNLTSSGIQLIRLDQTSQKSTNISAFITYYSVSANELLGMNAITKKQAALQWYINDFSTCEKAHKNMDSFGCRSSRSACMDVLVDDSDLSVGYVCMCSSSYKVNPYLPNRCLPITPFPSDNCSRRCGNIDIPFPFGLEVVCYRDETFALTCNQTSNGTILFLSNPPKIDRRPDNSDWRVQNILVEEGKLQISSVRPTNRLGNRYMIHQQGVTYSWVIDYMITCEDAELNKTTYACRSSNSFCEKANATYTSLQYEGYRCRCSNGYDGNPYLQNGCTDIDECQQPGKYICYGKCINTIGGYSCSCLQGTKGDPTRGPCISDKKRSLLVGLAIGISIGAGFVLILVSFVVIYKRWTKIIQNKMKQKFFILNHGLLLQQILSSTEYGTQKAKLFSLEELEKATNNFDQSRIVGRGGHGTVYKGILSDQRVVAIKISKITNKSEIHQFINEVAILSQVNHRNVVQLFGCCLETEVPLLVYEFISRGTLYDHLHSVNDSPTLCWEDRLRIATESAGALAYLHSAASISIFHRDVKSCNILLDDCFIAKVSDFGASRTIPADQSHIVTAVQGTPGYLDPEYYQTGNLTNKSDVYSFGVILLELIAGKKPIYSENGENMSLSMHFLMARENQLSEFMDARIAKEVTEEELDMVTQLAYRCLKFKGTERPTMEEVEFELQGLQRVRNTNMNVNTEPDIQDYDHISRLTLHDEHASIRPSTRNYSLENEFMSSIKYPR